MQLSASELFETYLVTIGRGNTYILNMPPNTTGVIPEYLYNETALLGQATRASFSPESAQARLVNQTVDCGAGAAPLLLPPPAGGFAFDAVILEEDIGLGNQRIAGYELQTCSEPGGACAEAQWATINAPGTQTVSLGVTVGRRVIERGFNRTDGASVVATGLRFRCTAAFPAGTSQAFLRSFCERFMSAHACACSRATERVRARARLTERNALPPPARFTQPRTRWHRRLGGRSRRRRPSTATPLTARARAWPITMASARTTARGGAVRQRAPRSEFPPHGDASAA